MGKFEGERGFSGTLPPLQGQSVMQFAELPAKIFLPTRRGSARTLPPRQRLLGSLQSAFLTPWKGLGQLLACWFSPQTGSGISLAWWRGLPDFLEGPTVANRGLSGLSLLLRRQATPAKRWGSLKGRGASQAPSSPSRPICHAASINCRKSGQRDHLQTRVPSTFAPKRPSRLAF